MPAEPASGGWRKLLQNDLEEVVREKCPAVAKARRELEQAGALGTGMSGSGPTVFGIFPDLKAARKAARALGGDSGRWVAVVKPVK